MSLPDVTEATDWTQLAVIGEYHAAAVRLAQVVELGYPSGTISAGDDVQLSSVFSGMQYAIRVAWPLFYNHNTGDIGEEELTESPAAYTQETFCLNAGLSFSSGEYTMFRRLDSDNNWTVGYMQAGDAIGA